MRLNIFKIARAKKATRIRLKLKTLYSKCYGTGIVYKKGYFNWRELYDKNDMEDLKWNIKTMRLDIRDLKRCISAKKRRARQAEMDELFA